MPQPTMGGKNKNSKAKKQQPLFVIDESWVLVGAEKGLKKAMEAKGFVSPLEADIPKLVTTTKGTDAKKLAKEYGNLWICMYKYFCYVGDYSSALIVNRKVCPATPPPLDPITVCTYISYMCNKPGTAILHPKTQEPVVDRNGKPVLACGTWTSPNSVWKAGAAIKALCNLYRHIRVEIAK
jgi:hypothetical protein